MLRFEPLHVAREGEDKWGRYWGSKKAKRSLIEFFRKAYFAKIFAHVVRKNCVRGPVLEAGCGTATVLKHLPRTMLTVGVDISVQALKIAQENCKWAVNADLFNLPFKDKSFELAFNQGVMEHFPPKEFHRIIAELKRVSKKVLIIVPSSLSIFQLYNPFHEMKGIFFSKKKLYRVMSEHFREVHTFYLIESFFLSVVAVGED